MIVKDIQDSVVIITKFHLKDEMRVSRYHDTIEMYKFLREYDKDFEKELIDEKIM